MKTSSLLSAITVGLLFAVGSVSRARTDTFTRTHNALAPAVSRVDVTGATAHEALSRFGGSHRLFELASNGSATSNPCRYPQSPRPVGQTNSKKKILSPATVPPCTPPPIKRG